METAFWKFTHTILNLKTNYYFTKVAFSYPFATYFRRIEGGHRRKRQPPTTY
jgi:hypothetical protein